MHNIYKIYSVEWGINDNGSNIRLDSDNWYIYMKKILLMIGMAYILASNPVYAKETYMCFDPTTTQKFIAFTLYRASEVIVMPSDRSILHLPFVYDKKVDSKNPFLGTTKGFYKNEDYGINVFYNSIPEDPNVISAVWINFKHNVAMSLLCKRQ